MNDDHGNHHYKQHQLCLGELSGVGLSDAGQEVEFVLSFCQPEAGQKTLLAAMAVALQHSQEDLEGTNFVAILIGHNP